STMSTKSPRVTAVVVAAGAPPRRIATSTATAPASTMAPVPMATRPDRDEGQNFTSAIPAGRPDGRDLDGRRDGDGRGQVRHQLRIQAGDGDERREGASAPGHVARDRQRRHQLDAPVEGELRIGVERDSRRLTRRDGADVRLIDAGTDLHGGGIDDVEN